MQALEIVTPAQKAGLPTSHQKRIYDRWLARMSPSTQRGYAKDLKDWARFCGAPDEHAAVEYLLDFGHAHAVEQVMDYQDHLKARGLAPATINRRVSALRSLVKLARKLDRINWALDVDRIPSKAYRDVRGPGLSGFNAMVRVLGEAEDTPKTLRDRALLMLLFGNALRRNEVAQLDLDHLDLGALRVWIVGKGRTQEEPVTVSPATVTALRAWLEVRGELDSPAVFTSLDNRTRGHRLDGESINRTVQAIGRRAGIENPVRAHGLRHAAITVLVQMKKDPYTVQKFARHSSLDTTMRYVDAADDLAGEAANALAGVIGQ